jgi:hypothetical protein
MSDNIIKNRNRSRVVVTPEPYQPEYERLGREPVVQSFDRREFIQQSQSNAKKSSKSTVVGSAHTVGSITGQSEEVIWTKNLQDDTNINNLQEFEDNQKIVDAPLPPTEEFSSDEEIDINNVNVGDFILINKGNVVSVGSSNDILKDINILLNDRDTEISDLLLLKRVNIKYSISIDE